MSDPNAARGANRIFPGTLGGRSRIPSPRGRARGRKFTQLQETVASYLTVAILPTSGGFGTDVYEVVGSSCPSFLGDANAAVAAFDPDGSAAYGIGVCSIGGVTYLPVVGFNVDSLLTIYWIRKSDFTVTHSGLIDSTQTLNTFGNTVAFDGDGGAWYVYYDGGANHMYLAFAAFPGLGSDYGSPTNKHDFGTGFAAHGVSLGWNPYDDHLYYKPNIFSADYLHRHDGTTDEQFTAAGTINTGGNMCAFTPDGAVWMMWSASSGVVRYDGTFATVSIASVDDSGCPVPLDDNSVLVLSGTTEKNVTAGLSVSDSACDLHDGGARVATGRIA